MRRLLILAIAATLSACGSDGPATAEDTARAWVDAINAQDWERACELSIADDPRECETAVAAGFSDAEAGMRIESFDRSGQTLRFSISTPAARGEVEPASGWTAYGQAEYTVERQDGEYRVHFDVLAIR